MNTLAQNLKAYMKEQNLSVGELEHLAGLKMSAVKNIIQGKSERPRAETLLSISRVLGCSIQDLLGEPNDSTSSRSHIKEGGGNSQMVEDIAFFVKATESIATFVQQHYDDRSLNFSELSDIIREVYIYSLKNSYPEVDLKFAEWFIERR